jgi:hypothetical protein
MKRCLICLVLMMPLVPTLAQDYLPRDVQRWPSPIVTDTSVRRILDFQTVLG